MILLIILQLISFQTNAQELKRNVFLGARLMDLSAVEQDLGTNSGIYLSEILPDASFGMMNIPAQTVLKSINNKSIVSLSDLGNVLHGIKEGDDLSVEIWENKDNKIYHGKAVGKKKEIHPNAVVEYGVVKYEGNKLRSLLYLPKGVGQPPVVFFIQGYTCQSIEMRNDNPAKQLIDGWVDAGYAVFLVEKPGMGDSESDIPCMDIDFDQELHAFSKAYKELIRNRSINSKQIFLFGHSMGGIIAPLLAHSHSPAGIMVFGIVGKNWYDYMQDIYIEQPLIFGSSKDQIEENKKYYLPFVKDLLVNKKSNVELLENPIYGKRLEEDGIAQNLKDGYYIMRHYRYWQTLADKDVPKAWSKVKSPVYVLHGEYDIQAIDPKYGEMISINVNDSGGKAQFELFPKTEHAFLKFESKEELLDIMNTGGYSATFKTHFNKDITTKSLNWMNRQISK